MKEPKFHLIGVGGIGMSALARLLIAQNQTVSGSDLSQTVNVRQLEQEGIVLYKNHLKSNIRTQETTVVYSTAISATNPEFEQAKVLQCPLWHRSELLNYLMQPYKSLSITGTHGKTSTSALLTHVLSHAGESPTYVIGGISIDQQSNSQKGEGDYFVLEADESDGSFLRYHPYGSIVTNLEEDHLDYYYKDLAHIKECFSQYISQVKNEQAFFWCMDCPNLRGLSPKGFSYGFHPESDLKILSFRQDGWKSYFSLDFQGKKYVDIELSMGGKQNTANAVAVFGLCTQLGLNELAIRAALKSFKGVKRRGERIGCCQNIQFIDDYAHHPTEVQYALKSLRKSFPQRNVVAIFQPHRYSRMKYFKEAFAKSFSKCSQVILTDVYSAGEEPLKDFEIDSYAKEIQENSWVPTEYIPRNQLSDALLKKLKPHDVVVTLGAGDITYVGSEVLNKLKQQPVKLKVGVICGSRSSEHYISLISSKFFLEGLDSNLYEPVIFRIDLEGNWQREGEKNSNKEALSSSIFEELKSCDILFPVLHGPHGEDGMIQGFLHTLKKPYIGPHYMSCSLTMNKVWTKAVMEKAGIKVAKSMSVTSENWFSSNKKCLQKIKQQIPFPMVIKPVCVGSSLGVSFVYDDKSLTKAIQNVLEIENTVLIEEKIIGKELEICILDGEKFICPRPGEIKSNRRQYDYAAKYSSDPIEKIPQANLQPKEIEKSQLMAKKVYEAMGGNGFVRIDFFIDKKGDLIFSEANPIPGCTSKSLFPRMLKAYGLTPYEIIDQMVIHGLYNYRLNKKVNLKALVLAKSIQYVTE
ncbi:MAG: UDP-N-acetylmuramate--L-alanine ligase [Chlamydiae bacterium]|nr:UDP-N-acetylmuramate--L-alanine ligase [Chlamydiota bacterium]